MTNLKDQPEEYWRQKLTPEQYKILREGQTERAFTGAYNNFEENGMYVCGACGQELFSSDTKYDAGSGWPSFYQAVDEDRVQLLDDYTHGMHRIEVRCNQCGSHLGHVFGDSSNPTGKYYCINSTALNFQKK